MSGGEINQAVQHIVDTIDSGVYHHAVPDENAFRGGWQCICGWHSDSNLATFWKELKS